MLAKKPLLSGKRKATLDCALIRMLVKDMRPLKMVEDEGFKSFVSELDSR